jgi:transposase-like protein
MTLDDQNHQNNQTTDQSTKDTLPKCPHCGSSKKVVRSGFRKTTQGQVQRYTCKTCQRSFSIKPLPRTSYPPRIIFSAISTYNLGHSPTETIKIINRRFKTHIPNSTLFSWLSRYKDICTFFPLRKKYQIVPKDIIFTKKFHHQQVYEFKYHKLKLNILGKQFPDLKSYLTGLTDELDNKLFKDSLRCSDFPFELKSPKPKVTKYTTNNAIKIAGFGIELARNNRERHQTIEDFFLINDSATVATEIPVFLTPKEARSHKISIPRTLTGHIDILQVRGKKIRILDYKPEAKNDKQTEIQLTLYAMALKSRVRTPLSNITCAYFNEDGYYQFTPGL